MLLVMALTFFTLAIWLLTFDSDYGSTPVSVASKGFQVPNFDGSAREWVEAINQAGLKMAVDDDGKSCEKLAPYLNKPVHVQKNDSFIVALPYSKVNITYGIDYPQAPVIGHQWFSSALLDESFYSSAIASSRTFSIYEEMVSLFIEAVTWCSMLVMTKLETRVYIRESRWSVRFGVIYALVGDTIMLNMALSVKDYYNWTFGSLSARPLTDYLC